ncbi:DUF1372 family protein [Streptococcus sp. E17BB]|uniref:DUF1372 family protein n=1 Tax=Streptococcus sp. E17BB TaxID=3278714 RepID=UPI00359D124F
MKHFENLGSLCAYIVILLSPLVIIHKMDKLEAKVTQHKVIYYQVDSYGGAWHGKVTKKEITETGYAVEVGTYGRFLVTKEQYDTIKVGDEAPEFLKKRGS